jgi:hypothetical protein
MFCEAFGTNAKAKGDSVDERTGHKRRNNKKVFSMFRTDAIVRHLSTQHPKAWKKVCFCVCECASVCVYVNIRERVRMRIVRN